MNRHQVSIGKDNAIALYDSQWWKDKSFEERAKFQLFTAELSMPFSIFHEAMEKCLDRPVWTHEFGLDYDGLVKEFLGERQPPTMEEIMNLIPEEKRVILVVDK